MLMILSLFTGCNKGTPANNGEMDDKIEIINENVIPEKDDKSKVPDDAYSVNHTKNNSTYKVAIIENADSGYTISVYDSESNQLQSIPMDIFIGIDFQDLNLDGYTDIVINTGGTWNETHDLYVWDSSSNNYVKVSYVGFEMLSFFEVYEGYIKNFIRGDSPEDSIMEKLIWDGNTLVKDSNFE